MQTNRLNIMARADVSRRGSSKSKFLLMALLAAFCMVGSGASADCPPLMGTPMSGANWMCFVPDHTSLFNMSLPGTHETMARFPRPPSDNGKGFFDDRLGSTIKSWNIPSWVNDLYKCFLECPVGPPFCLFCPDLKDDVYNTTWAAFVLAGGPEIVHFYATCQQKQNNLKTQLDNGIREVDIRFLHVSNHFLLYHEDVPMNDETSNHLEFGKDVLTVVTDWLELNKSETVVMRLRHEDPNPVEINNNRAIDETFIWYTQQSNPHNGMPFENYIWQPDPLQTPPIPPIPPTLGEARGKLIILQDNWTGGNDPNLGVYGDSHDEGGMDNSWETADLDALWNQAEKQLINANSNIQSGATKFQLTPLNANDPQGLLSSYFSAPYFMATGNGEKLVVSAFPDNWEDWIRVATATYTPTIYLDPTNVPGMNARTEDFLQKQSSLSSLFRAGIVSMDFAPEGLIREVYSLNCFDTTAPVVTITQPAAVNYLHSATITLNYTVSDGTGSGVATVTPTLDGKDTVGNPALGIPYHGLTSGQTIKLLTELRVGQHTFKVTAVDNCGNQTDSSVTFWIIVTPQSIEDDLKQFIASGQATLKGTTFQLPKMELRELVGGLMSAAAARADGDCFRAAWYYQDFIGELGAQSGVYVNPTAAAIMIGDARYLLAHCP